ncbi:hypothetical protein [Pseudooceanicola sp. HF7]|uniref:hypothetical protein n=1 Tax=Pseudooceanicola sp. HF7 TaxID=2721560 RepID=UPI0014317C2C|nr:hypothetical protein [Pseudooceanicola sp. HF7]NIZ11104.1 hypothetical protein [Pseudooceanicola sp. HF7]
MLRWFMKLVFGGRSNKREATLFAFLISVAWDSFILWKVGQGVDMAQVVGLASTVTVITFTGLVGATALDHLGGRDVIDRRRPPRYPPDGAP